MGDDDMGFDDDLGDLGYVPSIANHSKAPAGSNYNDTDIKPSNLLQPRSRRDAQYSNYNNSHGGNSLFSDDEDDNKNNYSRRSGSRRSRRGDRKVGKPTENKIPRPGTAAQYKSSYPKIGFNPAKTTNDFGRVNKKNDDPFDGLFDEDDPFKDENKGGGRRARSRRSNSRVVAKDDSIKRNSNVLGRQGSHDPFGKNRRGEDDGFDFLDPDPDPSPFENSRKLINSPQKSMMMADMRDLTAIVDSTKVKELKDQIAKLEDDLRDLRNSKEMVVMEAEKTKGLLEAENKGLKQQIDELKRSLHINKETSSQNLASKERNYLAQIQMTDARNKEIIQHLRDDHKEEMKHMRNNYEEMISNLREANKTLELEVRNRKHDNSKVEGKLNTFELKLDNIFRENLNTQSKSMAESKSKSELEEHLKQVRNMLKTLKERQENINMQEKTMRENFDRERKEIQVRERRLEDKMEKLRTKESELEREGDRIKRSLVQKEKSMRDRENQILQKEDNLRAMDSKINRAKVELEDRENEIDRKAAAKLRELNLVRHEVEERDFESQRNYKKLLEQQRNLSFKEDSYNTRYQTLRIKEQDIETQKKEINQIAQKLKAEQEEITHFRENFGHRERRLKEEKEKLNALEIMISNQIDRMNTEKTNLVSSKKTLDSLRSDYVKDLKSELQRDEFMRQDLAFRNYSENGLKRYEDYAERAKRREMRMKEAEISVAGYARQKFNLDNFVSDIKNKYM